MMYVERHFTKGSKEMERLCSSSRELYNRCCFILRQAWFRHEALPRMQALTVATRSLECCKAFGNTKTAKQTIRRCLQDWTNF